MATSDIKRDYTMLDSELCMYASNLCRRLTRDLSSVSSFGITAGSISSLKVIGDAFEVFPPDDAFLGDSMLANQTKNELAEQVRESIRNMALRLQLKWGTGSPQYRSLGDLNVSKANDEILLGNARKVLGRMENYLSELNTTGLVQDNIDDFHDLIESYENSLNEVSNAIELRDRKTKERITKGNELYSYVVNYSEIGKRVFEKTDPARYNDYILYSTPSSSALRAPSNLEISLVSGSTSMIQLTWNEVSAANSYKVYRSVVANGAPAGVFTFVADQNGWIYVGNIIEGSRNYFAVESVKDTQTSAKSEAVFIQV